MKILNMFKKNEYTSNHPWFICLIILAQICWSNEDTSSAASSSSAETPTDDPVDLSELSVVCDIRNGLGQVPLIQLPSGCTAAASSHNNLSIVRQMTRQPRNVPFILYFNGLSYFEWGDNLNNPEDFVNLMQANGIDGIIFNNMYSVDFENPGYNVMRNENMYTFFSSLKKMNPNGLYGLAIPAHAELLPTAFNYARLDPVLDFYVIKTIRYRRCKFKDTMSRTTTPGDMRKSLNCLNTRLNGIVSMTKVLLTVQLYSEGVRRTGKYDIISYSDMCGGKELSSRRKYCKDSLKTLSQKASLRNEFGMLGLYVQYVDYDDIFGLCNCDGENGKKYPGLAALIAGSQQTNNADLNCEDFGNLNHN